RGGPLLHAREGDHPALADDADRTGVLDANAELTWPRCPDPRSGLRGPIAIGGVWLRHAKLVARAVRGDEREPDDAVAVRFPQELQRLFEIPSEPRGHAQLAQCLDDFLLFLRHDLPRSLCSPSSFSRDPQRLPFPARSMWPVLPGVQSIDRWGAITYGYRMEIRLLRSFQALAEQGHFGRASRTLHLSQPALTKQIRQLEDEVGSPLFVRGRRGAQLTRVGRLFADEVAPLLRHADRVLDRVRRAARGDVGELRLGFGIATRLIVPRLVSAFRQAHPQVHVTLEDMSSPAQLDALERGSLDVGFVRLPIDRPLAHIPVVEDRLVLAVPASRREELARLPPRQLRDEPFIELAQSRSPSFYAHVLRVAARYGFRPRVVQSASESFTVLALVAAGM